MDDIVYFLKRHRKQIFRGLKKAFTWWKQHQAEAAAGAGAGAGAAAGGAWAHHEQQQQHGQTQGQGYIPPSYPPSSQQQQQPSYGGGAGGWPEAPPSWHAAAQGIQSHPRPNFKDNAVNSRNPEYKKLRDQARSEGDKMSNVFDASHKAYSSGDGARAKELSSEGNQHKARMNELNAKAAAWIFQANNQDSASNEVDLHGLYVKEALDVAQKAVAEARRRQMPDLRFIVGQGEHSAGHVAKIKPAIESMMRDENLTAKLDPHNRGVVVVYLSGGAAANQGAFGGGDFTRQLGNTDADCVIM